MNKQNRNFLFSLQWIGMLFLSGFVIYLALSYHAQLEHFRSLGLIGIFLINLVSALTIFLPSPSIAAVIAGGSLYNPFLVALFASAGSVIGDCTSYALGFSGKKVFVKKAHKRYEKIIAIFQKYGGIIVFLFAMVPNPVFDGIAIAVGILGYPLQKFILWVFVGRLIRNLLLAFFGVSFHV